MVEILVALTNTAGDQAAMAHAAALVEGRSGHLTLVQPVELPGAAMGALGSDPITRMQPAVMQALRDMDSSTRSLRSAAARLRVPYDIEVEDGSKDIPLNAIAQRAQLFDFAAVACGGERRSQRRKQHATFSAIAFGSGRPVLAVPARMPLPAPLRHAVLAWNGAQESARAIHDFCALVPCDRASIVAVAPSGRTSEAGHLLAEFLVRKGRRAAFHEAQAQGRPISDVLTDYALEAGADLLVCGAYGHSRAREWMLGGTTRDLLDRSHIPVFFSR